MADRPQGGPEKGSPEYRWLYGSKGQQPSDDETRAIPEQQRGDETRVMPAARREARGGGAAPAAPPRRPAGGGPPARSRRPRFRLRWLWLLLVLWLVFLVVVPLLAWSRVDKVNAFPKGDRPADQPGTTYLMVGSDSRGDLSPAERRQLGTGNASGNRTDTIMLLHTGAGPNLLMSIPRDSIVEVPGYGQTKINAAYAYDGPRLLVRTVEGATGIRIDHFVEVGFGGFVDLVDAVGGIEVCPPFPMNDPLAKIKLKEGCQEVDGPDALGYARSRKTDEKYGDLGRASRQREVVSAIGREAVSPWSVLNPVRYYRLNMAGARAVRVSEGTSPFSMARWALAMTRVNGENGLTCGVPVADFAVNWDQERSEQMFTYIREDDTESIPKQLCTPTGFPR
ncbi:LCP family protein [Nocardioides coralli]|uniref:LCP family protein n=1 Tax=Nocardioides coralli TaxID=2872154 RepID=UPI001CA3F43E|nr:LCP family protein [Nocardioides coralli]QZY30002.1 LCP family protein [Nocardioides coralli]